MPDIYSIKGRRPSSRKKRWQKEQRRCLECGAPFTAVRPHQKFCSNDGDCRRAWYRSQNRWSPDPETVERDELLMWVRDYLRRARCLEGESQITLSL